MLAYPFDVVLIRILFLYKNPLFDLVPLRSFSFFFLEERDIKGQVKYFFTPDFNRGG